MAARLLDKMKDLRKPEKEAKPGIHLMIFCDKERQIQHIPVIATQSMPYDAALYADSTCKFILPRWDRHRQAFSGGEEMVYEISWESGRILTLTVADLSWP